MTAVERLDELLREERGAIRRMDGAALEALAAEKDELVRAMLRGDPDTREALRARTPSLRRNLLLLTHARDCLRDVLDATTGPHARKHRISLRG